jgi:hypothetical protein
VLIHLGEDRKAVDVLAAADSLAARVGHFPTRAWLSAIACHSYARLGDGEAAWRAYGEAEGFRSQPPVEEIPSWLSFFHQAHIASAAGRAYLGLGQVRNARRELERALAQHPPRLVRERGQFLAHLAEATLAAGEVDAGCSLLGDAFDIATRTRSVRIASRVRDLRVRIPARYRTGDAVRGLDERIRGASQVM